MKKKLIALIILCGLCMPSPMSLAVSYDYKGRIESSNEAPEGQETQFTNETKKLDEKQEIVLSVSQVINGSTAIEGDEFFAEVSKDVLAESGILLPKGTVAHGTIKNISDPKRLNRDGYVELAFDYLITPDGREIPIEGGMSSKMHPVKSVPQTAGENIAHTAIGGVYGALAAVEVLGLEGAVLSQGYTVAGGAAIGGLVALGLSLFRKGKDVLIAPGDEIKIKVKSDEAIPVMTFESNRQKEYDYEGLDVMITDIILEKDIFDNLNTYTLDLIIKNNSKTSFTAFDVAMVNDLNTSFNPSIFTDYKNSLAMRPIKKGENVSGMLSFTVDNPKRQHWLVFYDKRTHKPLARISIDNAKKDLKLSDSDLTKKRKKKKR